MADNKDPIERAIESAESLLAFRAREKSARSEDNDGSGLRSLGSPVQDPEQSLFLSPADQSLVSEGAAFQWPSNKTASSEAILPPQLDDKFSPKQSLHALVNKVTDSVVLESATVESLQKALQERDKDIEVAAKLGQFLLFRNETLETDLSRTLEQKALVEQQLRYCQQTMVKKEELLQLYASEQQEDPPSVGGARSGQPQPGWVQLLSEECRELRESNSQLQAEADRLKNATSEVEQQERELVTHCMEQFSEAKKRLAEVRIEVGLKEEEKQRLSSELESARKELEVLEVRDEELTCELELLKEQLADSQDQNQHLGHNLGVIQDSLEEATVLLKEAREENVSLKAMATDQPASSPADSGHVEHESIVQEIEEALRKEIVAASTLTERPRSPNNYAQQRTMVVMETVRAATLASSRRRRKKKSSTDKSPPLPMGSSSPSLSIPAVTNGMQLSVSNSVCSPSSGKGVDKVQEELIRYRQQSYVAPEKLQIVKPMEGSVTLLKWKLLASPQLGGATTYFSDASRPGVHLKKWKAGGIQDLDVLREQDTSGPSGLLSLEDSMELNQGEKEGPPEINLVQKKCLVPGRGIEELLGEERDTSETQSRGVDVANWLNTSTPLTSRHRPQATHPPGEPKISRPIPQSPTPSTSANSSLLGQVGSFLNSSWSRISQHGSNSPDGGAREEWRPLSSADSVSSTGISAMDPGSSTRTQ